MMRDLFHDLFGPTTRELRAHGALLRDTAHTLRITGWLLLAWPVIHTALALNSIGVRLNIAALACVARAQRLRAERDVREDVREALR